jgi:chorismate dehydratase
MQPDSGIHRILADSGSRSSVVLLDSLIFQSTGNLLTIEETDPGKILEGLNDETGGLLIGDSALQFEKDFIYNPESHNYRVIDLSDWWNKIYSLPFVFALWAYRKEKKIPAAFFTESLKSGISNISEIIKESEFPDTEKYLTENLHYYLKEEDHRAVETFRNLLHNLDMQRQHQKNHSSF